MAISALIISEKVGSDDREKKVGCHVLERRQERRLTVDANAISSSPPKASTTAKVMKSIASIVMLVLVAHCWLCVFTFYDDNNGKMSKYSSSIRHAAAVGHLSQLLKNQTRRAHTCSNLTHLRARNFLACSFSNCQNNSLRRQRTKPV